MVAASPLSVSITPPPHAVGPSLMFFGDSITYRSAMRLVGAFGQHYRVSIDAQSGIRTAGLEPHIEVAAENPPDIVVINLGTNDVICQGPCAQKLDVPAFDADVVNQRFDHFFHLFPSSTCVIFVNISTHNPLWAPGNAALLNAHLATFPHVVDWNAAWQPGWFDLTGDPHPNAAGQEALIALIRSQIAACPAKAPATH